MRASRSEAPRVTIRMYRQGLGDAFLLGFHGVEKKSVRWVLIDCGVVGRKDAAARTQKVAADIAATTKSARHPNGHLHLLVVSNVRWNHISGFVYAAKTFQKMAIDEIWLPATEDTGNEQARQRVRERQTRLKELHRVARDLSAPAEDLARSMTGVLSLFGECQDSAAAPAADAAPEQSAAALALLQTREQTGTRIRYLDVSAEPQLLFPDFQPAIRVYVLGPRVRVEAGGAGRDPAAEKGARDLAGSFLAAAQNNLGLTPEEQNQWKEILERNLPFAPSLQTTFINNDKGGRDFKPAPHADFFETRYFAESESWRRVDNDWMSVARGLALALDQEANNASMVLAFELVESEKVLLFPGDAQLGVWKSWDALKWALSDNGRCVTARDLLRRTAVYKVAHHCSQTGTLIEGGLKLMERGDLVALLPVDRASAKTLGWDLPYAPLLNHLRAKTRGRILITDPQEQRLNARPKPDDLTEAEWQAFRNAAHETDLYIEYTLSV
jgi:hypothetical protein